MAYTTINKHTDYFNTKLYTGNGSVRTETGVGFQPDLTWIKDRTGTNAHTLTDAVRGVNYQIYSNLTNAQTNASGYLTAFASDGFTLGTDGAVNTNSSNYVSWNWKANGAGSSNSNGSITSTVSANTTSGFSIVKYTGTGANATVGHGLGVAPKMVLVKKLSGSADDWLVYHSGIGATKYMKLNNTVAASTASVAWNDTAPTTTVFSIGTSSVPNASGEDYIAYCFADKTGYSRFGSYTGNGNADGTFIYTGFKPAFIMVKRTDSTNNWHIYDNKRPNSFNEITHVLLANDNVADQSSTSDDDADFVSNGVKMRCSNNGSNGSSASYIYMAFGQSLVGSNNIPCTAR